MMAAIMVYTCTLSLLALHVAAWLLSFSGRVNMGLAYLGASQTKSKNVARKKSKY